MIFTGQSGSVGAPVSSVLDMRRALRSVRRAKEWTLDALSDASGIDRAAIHRIENVQKYPDYEPGLDTFRRLVEAMQITMPEFFARLPPERQQPQVAYSTAFESAVAHLKEMNADGQAAAASLLEQMARAFPRQLPQGSDTRSSQTLPETTRKGRGTR